MLVLDYIHGHLHLPYFVDLPGRASSRSTTMDTFAVRLKDTNTYSPHVIIASCPTKNKYGRFTS